MQAYEVLSTPSLRAAYNEQLEVALQDDSDGFTGTFTPPPPHHAHVLAPARASSAVPCDCEPRQGARACVHCAQGGAMWDRGMLLRR